MKRFREKESERLREEKTKQKKNTRKKENIKHMSRFYEIASKSGPLVQIIRNFQERLHS